MNRVLFKYQVQEKTNCASGSDTPGRGIAVLRALKSQRSEGCSASYPESHAKKHQAPQRS